MVEINERVLRPKALPQLFACDHVTRALQQRHQNLKRLHLQFEANAVPAQLSSVDVGFKLVELVFERGWHPFPAVGEVSADRSLTFCNSGSGAQAPSPALANTSTPRLAALNPVSGF